MPQQALLTTRCVSGRGLVAQKPFEADELIFQVPRQCLFGCVENILIGLLLIMTTLMMKSFNSGHSMVMIRVI